MNSLKTTLKLSPNAKLTDDDPARRLIPVNNYAIHRLPEAFENFADVIGPLLRHGQAGQVFDVTVFYSRRRNVVAAEHEELLVHNQMAFDAAVRHGGLIIYYQGELLDTVSEGDGEAFQDIGFTPDCLSFCIWESLGHAKAGAQISEHKTAASHAGRWYEKFAIQKYELTRHNKTTGATQQEALVLKAVPFRKS